MSTQSESQPSASVDAAKPTAQGDLTRKTFSSNLHPLEVKSVASVAGSTNGTTAQTEVTSTTLNAVPLSLESERIIADKIAQLSQLASPQLRELARRLGDKYHIQTPRYLKPVAHNPYAGIQVGDRWKEIQGSKSWAGLLNPIDPILRAEISRYGEFAQATYDAFDADTNSKYAGSSKYTMEALLNKVGLDSRGYEITDFLYATADTDLPNIFTTSTQPDKWSKDSNWIGYVAVSTSAEEIARLGRRDILVAWRGTITKFEWIEDFQDYLAPAGFDPRDENVWVESGFLSVYKSSNENSRYNKTSARQQVLGAVKTLLDKYKSEGDKLSITVVGHSLGSALATLCGYDIAASKMNLLSATAPVPKDWSSQKASPVTVDPSDQIPVTVFSFAGPRVGNKGFKERVEALGVAVLRVVNIKDLVPKVPGVIFQDGLAVLQNIVRFLPSYEHVGQPVEVDYESSNYLQITKNVVTDIGNFHNLEAYLHLVDGFQGTELPFKPTMRDYALVNKGGELLKHEYYIPASWWQEAYKGLVRDKDGHWVVPVRSLELYPATPLPASTDKGQKEVDFFHCVSIAVEKAKAKLGK